MLNTVGDDDDDVLCAFNKVWREVGYETVTTWSGIEALWFLRSANFNASFMTNSDRTHWRGLHEL
jgi:CheY-like chemotaxis protein